MWPVPETMADQLNPVGTVVSNINTATSVSLNIEFPRYSHSVVYPSFDTVRSSSVYCIYVTAGYSVFSISG